MTVYSFYHYHVCDEPSYNIFFLPLSCSWWFSESLVDFCWAVIPSLSALIKLSKETLSVDLIYSTWLYKGSCQRLHALEASAALAHFRRGSLKLSCSLTMLQMSWKSQKTSWWSQTIPTCSNSIKHPFKISCCASRNGRLPETLRLAASKNATFTDEVRLFMANRSRFGKEWRRLLAELALIFIYKLPEAMLMLMTLDVCLSINWDSGLMDT